ncbi:hypothetical protein [Egicoccus sp. AB-alg6-2]|uniref:hypothetical protein n=1 Tax=Egicoccus sp. AB-alg6-2 TaxID=3242692 RepID=UPI00359EB7D9
MVNDRRTTELLARAAALLHRHEPALAARLLIAEAGWDASFQALALLRGEAAAAAFGTAWQALCETDQRESGTGPREPY